MTTQRVGRGMDLTVKDVAKLLKVSERTVYRWIQQEAIPAYKILDQYRFNRAELLQWAASRKIGVSADLVQEGERSAEPLPTLVEALRRGGIYYRVEGKTKEEVFRAMLEVMRLPEEVDREFFLRVLLAREELATTAVGDGIAIPHVRNPLVLHVPQSFVSLCFLDQAVEFGALDGQPVSSLFTVVSASVRVHLHLLSRLAFALRDAGFKESVVKQERREKILAEAARVEGMLRNGAAAKQSGK
ncbi:MAG: PTS sugar transporter subunit IIA [bacterium]|nr:PTS sugar transporter subunit IIA [bacterium]